MASRLTYPIISLAPDRLVLEHPASRRPSVVIEPTGWWPGMRLAEIWQYRNLFRFLVWRDLKVKYAQTAFGAGWAMIQPVLTMVIFTVIFGIFAGLPSDGVPFSLFALTALVPWHYLSNGVSAASGSLIGNGNLITKVYFPRLLIPFAPLVAGLIDMFFASAFLLVMMAWKGFFPGLDALIYVPLLIATTMLTAAGVGCWLAALNIQYRDVGYVIPFLLQVWMYCSAIFYPASMVPEAYRTVYALNPMVGVIEGLRTVLLGTSTFGLDTLGVSMSVAAILFITGIGYFRRTERIFADVI